MKPFDIEAAKSGAIVCTRAGNPVRILCFDEKLGNSPYRPIVATFEDHGTRIIGAFHENGRAFDASYTISDNDLMMADDDYLENLERGEYSTPVNDAPVWQEPHRIMTTEKLGNVSFLSPFDEAYWLKQYAGMAMQGLSSDWEYKKMATDSEEGAINTIAHNAVKMADALINELKNTPNDIRSSRADETHGMEQYPAL